MVMILSVLAALSPQTLVCRGGPSAGLEGGLVRMEVGQTPGRPNAGQCVWVNRSAKRKAFLLKAGLGVASDLAKRAKTQDLFYLQVQAEGRALRVLRAGAN